MKFCIVQEIFFLILLIIERTLPKIMNGIQFKRLAQHSRRKKLHLSLCLRLF